MVFWCLHHDHESVPSWSNRNTCKQGQATQEQDTHHQSGRESISGHHMQNRSPGGGLVFVSSLDPLLSKQVKPVLPTKARWYHHQLNLWFSNCYSALEGVYKHHPSSITPKKIIFVYDMQTCLCWRQRDKETRLSHPPNTVRLHLNSPLHLLSFPWLLTLTLRSICWAPPMEIIYSLCEYSFTLFLCSNKFELWFYIFDVQLMIFTASHL